MLPSRVPATRLGPRRLRSVSVAIVAVVVAAGCGGDDATSSSPTTSAVVSSTSAEVTTSVAPATTEAPSPPETGGDAFEAALMEAVRSGQELTDLRMACFTDGNLVGCLDSSEDEIVAAEAAAVDALRTFGAAATAAGLPSDRCEDGVDFTRTTLAAERGLLFQRAATSLDGGLAASVAGPRDYFSGLRGERIGPAGYEFAVALLGCVDGVLALESGGYTTAGSVGSFVVMSEIRTRPALLYNLWTVLHCLDQGPVDGTTCLDAQGAPRALEPLIEELGFEYEYLTEDEGFGELPEACRAALEEAYVRINASYEIFLDISARELVSTDIELLEMLGPATYPIEDVPQLSNPGPLYPLDETTVLTCVTA